VNPDTQLGPRRVAVVGAVILGSIALAVGLGFAASATSGSPHPAERSVPAEADDGTASIGWQRNADGTRAEQPSYESQPGIDSEDSKALDEFQAQAAAGRVPIAFGPDGRETAYISTDAMMAPPAKSADDVFVVEDAKGDVVAFWANPWGVIPLDAIETFDFSKTP
jgi:hypothetical protein